MPGTFPCLFFHLFTSSTESCQTTVTVSFEHLKSLFGQEHKMRSKVLKATRPLLSSVIAFEYKRSNIVKERRKGFGKVTRTHKAPERVYFSHCKVVLINTFVNSLTTIKETFKTLLFVCILQLLKNPHYMFLLMYIQIYVHYI